MKRLLRYFIFFAFILLYGGCALHRTESEKPPGHLMSLQPAYRGIYVNDFKKILGNSGKEDQLLKWARNNSFNALSLYMGDILDCGADNPIRSRLAAFIKRARTDFGIRQVAGVASHTKWFTLTPENLEYLSMERYNIQRKDPEERIDVFQIEDEWTHHNPSRNFKEFAGKLDVIREATQRHSPRITFEAYISEFNEWAARKEAQKILNSTDRILLTNYRTVPSLRYLLSRLKAIGMAAANNGRKANVIIIFSAEPDVAGEYFSGQSFAEGYASLYRQYQRLLEKKRVPIEIEENVRISGFQIFPYSEAKEIRP